MSFPQGYTSSDDHYLGNTMYAKILVPLDGSQLSETILPYTRSIAGVLKASVELLAAIEPSPHQPKGRPIHTRPTWII